MHIQLVPAAPDGGDDRQATHRGNRMQRHAARTRGMRTMTGGHMLGVGRKTWRTVRALAVLLLVTSAVMSAAPSTRAAAVTDVSSRSNGSDPDAATDWNAIAVQALAAANPASSEPQSRSWTWPSSRPPSTTPSRPSTAATHPIM